MDELKRIAEKNDEDKTLNTFSETDQQHEPVPISPNHSNDNHKQQKSVKSDIWKVWLGGIFGGLTVAVFGFLLLYTGVIPIEQLIPTDEAAQTETQRAPIIQTAGHGDGVPADLLSDVAGAVVGVSNLQSFNLWSDSIDAGTGSGVIYKIEGDVAYVVTNQHVIDGANQVEVIMSDGEHVEATLLGQDELTDLAVLSIAAEHVDTVAEFGSSSDLIVGEPAIAIGNPLGTEFAGTVTKGIISGLDRSIEVDINKDGTPDWNIDVIQTDAAINPGNSGGALINSSGQLIGINSMKIASHAIEGIGFAIPIDEALPIIEQLEVNGSVTRPFMGISAIDFSQVPPQHISRTLKLDPNEVTDGIVIAEVHPGSSADQAGLQVYDVVIALDEQPINNMLDLRQYLYRETDIGESVTISYYRDGELQEAEFVLQGE